MVSAEPLGRLPRHCTHPELPLAVHKPVQGERPCGRIRRGKLDVGAPGIWCGVVRWCGVMRLGGLGCGWGVGWGGVWGAITGAMHCA